MTYAELWDGEDDEDDNSDVAASDMSLEVTDHELRIYEQATPHIHTLRQDPGNQAAFQDISLLNEKISSETLKIPVSFFQPHYKLFLEAQELFRTDPIDQEAKENMRKIKVMIDTKIRKSRLP